MMQLNKFLLCLFLATVFSLVFSCQKKIKNTDISAAGTVGSDAAAAYVTNKYFVSPKVADPATTTALSAHIAYFNTNPAKKNILYVFLPGTYRDPTGCQATPLKAASLGYHAIGLMYDNLVAGNPLCKATGDTTCHVRARLEVIDGIDRHPGVNVNVANSLINRLYKLLVYMNNQQPTQNWGQFISAGKPNWSKIIIGGHSQGGALAGVIGKYYPVKRVIMYSMIDFLNSGKIPNWENSKTGKEKYFALINPSDEQVPYASVVPGWAALGMNSFGVPTNIATSAFPYNYSHTLVTTVTPNTTMTDKYHNGTGVDAYIPKDASGNYIYDKAWEYLIDKEMPVAPPVNQPPVANAGADASVALFWHFSPLLDGNGSKDPDGTVKSMSWSRVSGPTTYTIANPNIGQTRITFTGTGTYIFKLTAVDNLGAVGTDTKQIIVTP
jgi:hypothetical protein